MLLLISQALLLLATQQDTPEIPGKQDHIYATFLHCELLFTGHNT